MKMSDGFFQPGPASDRAYVDVRDKEHPWAEEAREFCEKLWVEFKPCADRHFRSDAMNNFHQRFWEMYLGVTLLRKGFKLVKVSDEGPEFYFMSGDKKVWVEAIAPNPGDGPDAVPAQPKGVSIPPNDKVILRYTSALSDKLRKYNLDVKKGIVDANDSYVLAVNCYNIPYTYRRDPEPLMRACLGVGHQAIVIDSHSGKTVGQYREFQDTVTKNSGEPISTVPFLRPEYMGISGILQCNVDVLNHPEIMGDDFEFLHNPQALQPIERSVFSFCRQYVYTPDTDIPGRAKIQTIEPEKVQSS
jgi:hypothetical protein